MATADVSKVGGPEPGAKPARHAGRTGLRSRAASIPTPLAVILAVAALQSIAWNLATPAFQGPDENAHYAYIQYLAETGHLPRPGPAPTSAVAGVSTEEQDALTWLNLQATLGNYGGRPAWTIADLRAWHQIERSLPPGSREDGSGPNPIAKDPPLYYAVMAIPYQVFAGFSLLKRIFVLRLFNALFYLATVALAWLIAGEVFGRVRWKQALTAGVVALEPQLAFMSAVINADNLLIALTTGVLLACLRLVKRGPTWRTVLAASVLTAAAVLTHGRGLVTLPVLAVALVVAWIQHRPAKRETLALGALGVAPVGVAFLAYFLFARGPGTSSLYGGQVGELNTKTGFKLGQFLSTTWNFYFEKLASLREHLGPKYGYRQVFVETFYGFFGSLDTALTKRVYDVLRDLSTFGVLGLCAAVTVRWRQLRRAWPVVVVMLALLLTMIVFLHYVNYRALLVNGGQRTLMVGRYLLPMVALFGLAIAFTAGTLPRRWGPLLGAAILGLGAVLFITDIALTTSRFYA